MAISFKGKLFKEINPDGAAMLRPELNPELDIDTLPATSKNKEHFAALIIRNMSLKSEYVK